MHIVIHTPDAGTFANSHGPHCYNVASGRACICPDSAVVQTHHQHRPTVMSSTSMQQLCASMESHHLDAPIWVADPRIHPRAKAANYPNIQGSSDRGEGIPLSVMS